MSVLEDMADVGDFKPKMRQLQKVAYERRAQSRALSPLLKNWTFLGKSGTGKTECPTGPRPSATHGRG